jgi:PKD domain
VKPKQLQTLLTLTLLILPINLALLPNQTAAAPATRTPGVKPGDMITYGEFKSLWASYVPGATAPQNLIDVNNTETVVNTILSVTNTTVTFESYTEYTNGTETTETKQVDVNTGIGTGNITYIAANLGTNDRVYTTNNVTDARLNATGLRNYCNLFRETSLLNTTQVFPQTSIAFWVEYYWDTTTGILAQQFWSYSELQGNALTQGSIEYKMTDNNIWTNVPDNTPPTANAGPDQTTQIGNQTIFDASASRDNIGIAEFSWNLGNGITIPSLRVAHTYDRVGVYNVTLTVTDGAGNKAYDYVTVTVQEKPYSSPTTEALIVILVVAAILLTAWTLSKRRHHKKRRR